MNYLYNGKELPALPEWNKTKRPYVLLVSHPGSSLGVTPYHRMYCSQSPFVWSGSYATSSPTAGYGYTTMSEGDTEWGSVYEDETATRADTGASEKPIWSNHDILNKDGSVYLAASYPINAETGEEIKDYAPIPILAPALDPLSLFLGWKAGNWVARQRGKAKPATGVYDDTMPIEWKTQNVANNPKIPLEVYQIYSYNGLEFGRPDIEADSDYKYHLIEKYSSGYHYWCLKQPFVYVNEDKEYAKIEGGYNYSLYICKTGEIGFGHHDDISGNDLKLNWEDIIWTNTNICDADGTVRMAATEPVYIREQVNDWLVKISNYIPSLEIFEKSAVSISYGGEEAILPYLYGENSDTGRTIVLFMDVTIYTNFIMLAIEKADNEVIPGEPGLYCVMDESVPSDVTFKLFVPDET